jgi:hypothetical protein
MDGMYTHTLAGLGQSYVAGIPFYRNDLASTALTVVALFGLPAVAARLANSFDSTRNDLAG